MNVSETGDPPFSPTLALPLNINDVVAKLQILRYVIAAAVTICIWDWVLALADEVQMVRRNVRRPCLGYFLSGVYFLLRVSTICFLIAGYHLAVLAPRLRISSLRTEAIFNCLIFPGVSGLFYVRLIAIYHHQKTAIVFFGVFWIAVFAYFIYDSICVIWRFTSVGLATPGHADAWTYILNVFYDTMVYLAISWQLAAGSIQGDSWRGRARSFVMGEGLPGLAKALLRSGQAYYFLTVGFGIATVICLYNDEVNFEYKGLMIAPNVTVASIMACRLYRELKLGIIPCDDVFSESEYGLQAPIVFAEAPFHIEDV